MKLNYSPSSPFVRKVHVTVLELGLADQVELVATDGTPLDSDPTRVAANPLGKIPSLVRPEGATLYDSRVITQYLNDLAGGALYPESHRWETLTLEATAEGIMDAAVSMAYEVRVRPEEYVFAPWVEAQWTKVSRALDVLEGRWMSHLHGPMDIGHIGTGCALGYLDLRHDARNWRAGRPSLAAWAEKFAARDSMVQTAPA